MIMEEASNMMINDDVLVVAGSAFGVGKWFGVATGAADADYDGFVFLLDSTSGELYFN